MADSRFAIEEIRNRVSVLEVISGYVTLQRSGKNYKGLCPFHAEKTPSFNVSEEFHTWHCFGCGEHGDVFSFLMKIENLTFPEVLERLAQKAGVQLESFRPRETSRRELLARINSLAAGYYSELLRRTPVALEYLRGRGLADQTIEQFRLGYAPAVWDGLLKYLGKKSISPGDAAQAGLVLRNDAGDYYDRFRHRIIFPILDIQERIIAFGGRTLAEDQVKYLNSPETPLFSKNRSLYALNLARKSISDAGSAVVVEGYTDAIAAHQSGFTNTVATLGTALTLEHIRVLSRYTKKVVLAYDSDSAGMAAALRGASMFIEAESDVRIARLPGGDDPDSLLRKGKVAEFDAAISGALPITDYKLALLREKHDLSTPAGRTSFLKEAVRILAEAPTFIEREQYIKELIGYHPNWDMGVTRAQDQIRADVEALVKRRQGGGAPKQAAAGPKSAGALDKAEDAVLRVLLSSTEESAVVLDALTPEDFSREVSRASARAVFEAFGEKKGIYLPELLETVDSETGGYLTALAMREEGPAISGKALKDCVELVKNSKLRKMRTSDVLGSYMKQGIIDPNDAPRTREELDAFLKRSGKLPGE